MLNPSSPNSPTAYTTTTTATTGPTVLASPIPIHSLTSAYLAAAPPLPPGVTPTYAQHHDRYASSTHSHQSMSLDAHGGTYPRRSVTAQGQGGGEGSIDSSHEHFRGQPALEQQSLLHQQRDSASIRSSGRAASGDDLVRRDRDSFMGGRPNSTAAPPLPPPLPPSSATATNGASPGWASSGGGGRPLPAPQLSIQPSSPPLPLGSISTSPSFPSLPSTNSQQQASYASYTPGGAGGPPQQQQAASARYSIDPNQQSALDRVSYSVQQQQQHQQSQALFLSGDHHQSHRSVDWSVGQQPQPPHHQQQQSLPTPPSSWNQHQSIPASEAPTSLPTPPLSSSAAGGQTRHYSSPQSQDLQYQPQPPASAVYAMLSPKGPLRNGPNNGGGPMSNLIPPGGRLSTPPAHHTQIQSRGALIPTSPPTPNEQPQQRDREHKPEQWERKIRGFLSRGGGTQEEKEARKEKELLRKNGGGAGRESEDSAKRPSIGAGSGAGGGVGGGLLNGLTSSGKGWQEEEIEDLVGVWRRLFCRATDPSRSAPS